MSEQSVRFAVRNDQGCRAGTWKLAVPAGKNDVYLFCRALGGAVKASLHESGRWHVGFLREFVAEHFGTGHPKQDDRYIERWPRPSAIAPGVTLAYRVLVPSSGVTIPIAKDIPDSIVWIPSAPPTKATEVDIVFTDGGARVSDWPGKNSMGTALVGQLPLGNGDSVWIVHRVVDVPDLNLRGGQLSWFAGRSKADLATEALRAVVFGSSDDGSRYMVDCAVATSTGH